VNTVLVGVWSSPTSHRRIAAMFLVLALVTLVVLSSLEPAAIGYLLARRFGASEFWCNAASHFGAGAGAYAGAVWGARIGGLAGGIIGAGIGALVGGL
jgi:uncharacterized membrane protein